MLKKRIIPCLDIKDGRVVKGINFIGLRNAGDAIELAKKHMVDGADELVFLDITATLEKRKTLTDLVEKIATEINIPFTVGGGIKTIEDAKAVINAGADKVSVNSAALNNPNLISDIAQQFGNQCVVVAIDAKFENNNWRVFKNGGNIVTDYHPVAWAEAAEKLGAGEILLTSMNSDGTKNGFAISILDEITKAVNIPVIASGGAGRLEHFKEVFEKTNVSAALAASIFHFGEISIQELKLYLKTNKIAIR
jgi:imidazole glycerol-phosphate synthase subunit HisF